MAQIIFRMETPRLILELNTDEDPRAAFCSCLKPQVLVRRCKPPFPSRVQTLLFYSSPNPPANYKVILKDLNKKIGIIGFFKWNPKGKSGTIGFSIDKHFRGQGLMTEACRAFIHAWFKEGEMEQMEAKCQPDNLASEKVLINSGMKKKETIEEPLYKGSRLYTLHVYSINRSDWEQVV